MKEKKREFIRYAYYDFAGIAHHLEDMARQGWQLEKIGTIFWHYRRAEPAEVRYAVVYFANASDLDAEPSQAQKDFWAMCQATGWQLVADRAQMQIFCNPDSDAIPIETDPVVQVENIHTSMKKSVVLSNLVVMVSALVALFSQFGTSNTIRELLSSPFSLGGILIWGTLALYCGWEVLGYLSWHRKATAAACGEGTLLPPRSRKWRQILLLTVCGVYGAFLLLCSIRGMLSSFSLLYGVVYATLLMGSLRISQLLMRKKGVSSTTNRVVSGIIAVAVSLVVTFGMVKLVLSGRVNLQLWGHANAETVTCTRVDHTYTYDFYRDTLPLTVEDLLGTEPDLEYSRRLDVSGTPFLSERAVTQRIPYYGDTDKPDLTYTVWETGFDFLYEPVKESFFKVDEYRIHGITFTFSGEWQPVDAAPWGALDAYQYYREGEPYSSYLLCYEDRFVEISFNGWDDAAPTEAQMALVHDALAGD